MGVLHDLVEDVADDDVAAVGGVVEAVEEGLEGGGLFLLAFGEGVLGGGKVGGDLVGVDEGWPAGADAGVAVDAEGAPE